MMEMKKLFTIGKCPVYFAGKGFVYRGLYIWTGKRNVRIIAFNRFKYWTGNDED